MLKFKLKINQLSDNLKKLDITHVECQKDSISGTLFNKDAEELTFQVWVTDLYNIDVDSHLTSVYSIQFDNGTTVSYEEDVVVNSVSKANKSFTFNIQKEMLLGVKGVSIETKYNLLKYVNNHWEITNVDKAWVDSALPSIPNVYFQESKEHCKSDGDAYINNNDEIIIYRNGQFETPYPRCVFMDIDSVGYGVDGYTQANNTIFYYENSNWENIVLNNTDLNVCLQNGKFTLSSIHEYNTKEYSVINLNPNQVYYTRENYILVEFENTHYFGADSEVYELVEDVNDRIEYYKTSSGGKTIVKSKEIPKLYLYFDTYDEHTKTVKKVKMEVDCYRLDDNKLLFNYDNMGSIANTIEQVEVWEINGNKLPSKTTKTRRGLVDANITKVFDLKLFPYNKVINNHGDYPHQDCFITDIVFQRVNFRCDSITLSYSLMCDTSVNTIKIPISQKFETDLYHDDMLKTQFADKISKSLINPIMDMEKIVYSPVVHNNNKSTSGEFNHINANFTDAYKIIFNLHFREHYDTLNSDGTKEEWVADKESYWNGTRVIEGDNGKKIVDLNGRVYNYNLDKTDISQTSKTDYFSYFGYPPTNPNKKEDKNYDGEKDYDHTDADYGDDRTKRNSLKEYQSDLVSYLGFSNNDIKYQKSKVKKSFLRVSFYDSDNIANQNLLHTATIFLDSGNLFAKYIKNISSDELYKKGSNIITQKEFNKLDETEQVNYTLLGDPLAITGSSLQKLTETKYNVNGLAVNREPMRDKELSLKNGDFSDNIGEWETLRMSSQIVVSDKFSSNKSSEGFYFYTYKNMDNGVFPSNIYMRVEFNHAGYGRTIPFIMPYISKYEEKLKEDESGYNRYTNTQKKLVTDRKGNKLKTFDDICYDWSEVDFDQQPLKEKDEMKVGYDAIKYMKYCHIKWKCRHDKKTQRYVYYLDPDVYGTGVTSDNGHGNNIILNLYEGKIK